MEEEGVLHGHLELLQPLLLQFSCLEEQLIALGTLVLNQEEHVSPLQGSRVENEGTCSEEGGTTRPLTLPLWGEKGQANYSLSAPRRAMHGLPLQRAAQEKQIHIHKSKITQHTHWHSKGQVESSSCIEAPQH